MKIGILETGLLNEKFSGRYDPYPVMFATLLNRAEQNLEYKSFSVIRGEFPESVNQCDGWLITGSRHGAYERLDWMLELEDFIRVLYRESIPLVGICFGHQIIAQALGGEVIKSDKGWSIGIQSYDIDQPQEWMNGMPQQVRIYAFHQDQISKLPSAASVFSSSEFCPFAGLSYGDSIISIQAHPEFEEAYELALIDIYGGNIVPEPVAAEALDIMRNTQCKADTQMLADWLAAFFIGRSRVTKA
jgi:GMP synthase-like glutamine amidotransferase